MTELLVIVNVGWQQNEKSFEQINKGSPVTVMHTMYLTMKGKWEYFLVNTLLIRLCAFFSFVFAINSLTSHQINCFAVKSSTTNQNVSLFKIVMAGN